jgi:purine-binding chemotaxis protein CheW
MGDRAAQIEDPASQRILVERARALARPLQADEPVDSNELLVIALGPEHYGVEPQLVREVLARAELTPVPGTSPWWLGVVNVRGTLYPVLDLRLYLSLPGRPEAEGAASVVLVSGAGLTIGIAVDEAVEIRRLATTAIGPALAGTTGTARGVLGGVTDDLLTVLDVESLLTDPVLVANQEA